jgi:cytochrome c oxidase subunit IV
VSTPTTRDEATGPVVETGPHEGGTAHAHPGEREYVTIALILAAITGVEVGFSYWHAVKGILAPTLILLSIVKFSMVVAFFMHLRFDNKILRRLFVTGFVLACIVYILYMLTLGVFIG